MQTPEVRIEKRERECVCVCLIVFNIISSIFFHLVGTDPKAPTPIQLAKQLKHSSLANLMEKAAGLKILDIKLK